MQPRLWWMTWCRFEVVQCPEQLLEKVLFWNAPLNKSNSFWVLLSESWLWKNATVGLKSLSKCKLTDGFLSWFIVYKCVDLFTREDFSKSKLSGYFEAVVILFRIKFKGFSTLLLIQVRNIHYFTLHCSRL